MHLNNNAQPRGGGVGLRAVGGAQGAAVPDGPTTPEFEMELAAAEAEGGADSDEADEADLLAAGIMSGVEHEDDDFYYNYNCTRCPFARSLAVLS